MSRERACRRRRARVSVGCEGGCGRRHSGGWPGSRWHALEGGKGIPDYWTSSGSNVDASHCRISRASPADAARWAPNVNVRGLEREFGRGRARLSRRGQAGRTIEAGCASVPNRGRGACQHGCQQVQPVSDFAQPSLAEQFFCSAIVVCDGE